MPHSPNEYAAIRERRHKVAQRYVRGQAQWEIAQAFEVDPATISRDLKAIQAEWLAQAVMDMDAVKARELAKIDAVEVEAWKAWGKSQENAETLRARMRGAGQGAASETEKISKGQAGNPRFLEVIQNCVKMRCAIFGIDLDAAPGPATVVTVVNAIDIQVVTGDKPLPIERPTPPSLENHDSGSA
jgi:hypothetical protein